MGFPFTLHGNVWAEAQFTDYEIARNIGPFLDDLLNAREGFISLTGVSFSTAVAATNNLTVPAGLPFQKGMRVVVGSTGSKYSVVFGYVSSYIGTTLQITNTVKMPTAIPATFTTVHVAPAGHFNTTYTTEGYINTASTTAAVRLQCALPRAEDWWGETFEDFIGYKPPARAGTYTPAAGGTYASYGEVVGVAETNLRWNAVCYGDGTAVASDCWGADLGLGTAESSTTFAMNNRAGFMQLQVGSAGSIAGLVLNGFAAGSGVGALGHMKVAFMLPVLPDAFDAAPFYVSMGMLTSAAGTANRPAQPAYQLLPPDPIVAGESYPRRGSMMIIDNGAFAAPTPYIATNNRATNTALSTVIKAGVWYTLTAERLSSATVTFTLLGDDGSSETYVDGAAGDLNFSPFICLGRVAGAAGNTKRTMYIDYAYNGAVIRN